MGLRITQHYWNRYKVAPTKSTDKDKKQKETPCPLRKKKKE